MKKKPDWIFQCHKCGHQTYVDKKDVHKILNAECSECGEEPYENWVIIGEGDYDNEFK